jgi:transposase
VTSHQVTRSSVDTWIKAEAATGTTLTQMFGVGPVIAATVIGQVADISRFASKDRCAACNGTAPIEVSSGNRTAHRLSRRGNRTLNHAAHMTAVTQDRHKHSEGRACYDKKQAEARDETYGYTPHTAFMNTILLYNNQ